MDDLIFTAIAHKTAFDFRVSSRRTSFSEGSSRPTIKRATVIVAHKLYFWLLIDCWKVSRWDREIFRTRTIIYRKFWHAIHDLQSPVAVCCYQSIQLTKTPFCKRQPFAPPSPLRLCNSSFDVCVSSRGMWKDIYNVQLSHHPYVETSDCSCCCCCLDIYIYGLNSH